MKRLIFALSLLATPAMADPLQDELDRVSAAMMRTLTGMSNQIASDAVVKQQLQQQLAAKDARIKELEAAAVAKPKD